MSVEIGPDPFSTDDLHELLQRIKPDLARAPSGDSADNWDVDLAAAGFDSLAIVELLTILEDSLGIEFPDSLISRDTFRSTRSVLEAVNLILRMTRSAGSSRRAGPVDGPMTAHVPATHGNGGPPCDPS